jgi:hypothetical protein
MERRRLARCRPIASIRQLANENYVERRPRCLLRVNAALERVAPSSSAKMPEPKDTKGSGWFRREECEPKRGQLPEFRR